MKPAAFDYVRAHSVAEACSLLTEKAGGARLIAGGQSLLPVLAMRLSAPEMLVDIGGIASLRSIAVEGDRLVLGALTRHAELLNAPLVRQHAPLLPLAAAHVAHPAIRNRGTLGGNLAHADPASELPACMLALDAEIVVAGAGGERRIAADDFFRGVYETALGEGEMIVAVSLPLAAQSEVCAFDELARRRGDYALVGLAATAQHDGTGLSALRLAFFAVGERPVLARRAAACLVGAGDKQGALKAAAAALEQDLTPHDDLQATAAMRRHLARVLLGRVMETLMGTTAARPAA